tara:strand:+ start:52 stop:2913 length:2862 start_codon:yes stop_codon:yes gene_type:complete
MAFFTAILGTIIKSVITGFAISKAVSWLAPKPEIPEFTQDAEATGVLVNKQSNNANIPVVYGTRLLGGTRVFLETSGTDNQYLYGALVLCEGEVNAITKILVEDKEVTFSGSFSDGGTITSNDSRFGDTIQVQTFYGTDSQVASSLLSTLTSWTSNHKLSGLCYVAFRITWDADKYIGIPKIQALVQGRKVVSYNSSSVAQTATFSTNPAWCLLDYLTNTRYGKGIDVTDIDIPSFYIASTIATTQVTPYSGASDINLFDCNAVIDTGQKLIDNTRTLLKGMRGFLPYAQGKYKLIIETTGSSVLTLNEDNIVGGIKLSSERKNEKYNRVQVNFVNPDKNYQSDTIVYDTDHSTLKTADGGFLQEGVIDLPTITNPYQALEFGEIVLQRSRNNLGLELTANYTAMNLAIGDIVAITSSITGMSAKPFRVVGMAINPSFEVALSLIEHQDAWYTFDEKTEVAVVPDTSFPDPFTVQPPASITLDDDLVEYNDGTVITRLLITVGDSPDSFADDFEIEVKQTLDKDGNAVVDDFRILSQGKALEYQLLNAIDGATYEVRARAINSLGVKSSFVTGTHKVIGATLPPANVQEFSISLIGSDQMQLSWLPVADLDVESYEIRYQKVSSGYSWFNSTDLVRVPRRSANSIILNKIDPPFTLGIKAIDKLGNESLEPALIVSSNVTAQGYQLISSVSEHPTFAGTFTNTFKRTETGTISGDNVITLDTISTFDEKTGLFDAVPSGFVFETGGINKNIIGSGFYNFNSTFTLPFVFDATFKIQLDMVSDDPYDLFDFGRGENLFENAKAPFDGNLPTNAGTNIQIGASETSLGDISTFTSVAQQGTFRGKFFKFRARLISLNNQSRALVKGLTVSLNLQNRTETGDDLSSGAGTYSVTFTNPFYATPNVNVTGQDMATGDYFVVTNKSVNGFDITFNNSSDTAISRTFDYQANGYGLKSA